MAIDSDTRIHALFGNLPHFKRTATGYGACCPAHEDRSPSLSIGIGNEGRILLRCHADCTTDAILRALGLTMSDLFMDNQHVNGNGKATSANAKSQKTYQTADAAASAADWSVKADGWRRVATWPYHAADGVHCGLTIRYDKKETAAGEKVTKTFRPVSRRADGLWVVAAMLNPRPLYRLPQLLKSKDPVFVTEGEKAADVLVELGLVATTFAGGAGAVRESDYRPLKGRRVVIVPDNDKAGEKCNTDLTAILGALAQPPTIRTVRLPGLPEKGDAVEFVAQRRQAGATDEAIVAELMSLVASDSASTDDGAEAAEPWPEPQAIPVDLLPVAPFDLELLPESFRAYVNDIAERMQCPPDYPAVALIVVLAGVVGTKLGIRPKRQDDWHVVPNLWGAAVGRPGVMKTPALRGPLKNLQRLQADAAKAFGQEMDAYEMAMEVYEVKKKQRRDAIKKAAASGGDTAAAAKEFDPGEKPVEPSPRRYLVNDCTVEKLGGLLNSNTNGLTLFRDELVGLFKSLDKDGQEGARAFYLEAWDGGGSFTYDRIARGTMHIPNVTLSLLGGIQPGKLLDYLRGAIQGAGDDDGLIQRLQLLVYPDVRRNWRNVDRWPETTARQRVWAVVERLNKLSNDPQTEEGSLISALPGIQFDKEADRYFLRFTDDAQELFDAWRTELEHRVRSSEEHHAIESHLSKYRSLIPSLALLIHLADDTAGSVGAVALQRAIGWAVYLETHMRRVYALGIDAAGLAGKMLSKHIQNGDVKDSFRARDIYRKCWAGLSDPQAVNQAIDLLVELHWLREELQETGGRKAYHYRINPRIELKMCVPPNDKTARRGSDEPFEPSVSSDNQGSAYFSSDTDATDPEAEVVENL